MKQEGIITRINRLMEKEADNPNSFSKKIGIDSSGFRKKLKGETPIMPKDIKKICEAFGVSKEWLEEGKGNIYTDTAYNNDYSDYSDSTDKIVNRMLGTLPCEKLDRLLDIIIDNNPYELENKMLKEQVDDLRKQVNFLQDIIKRGKN